VSDPRPKTAIDVAALRQALVVAGLRFTRQRLEVYRTLCTLCNHPTAEEVFRGVRVALPKISLATVYKSLDALVQSGVAARLDAPGESIRYDARDDRHYHLRCVESGRVQDLPTKYDVELIAKLDPTLPAYLESCNFELTGYRLELIGRFREQKAVRAGEEL
jgi:Fur family transcriptional regulator, peroxide stress response regulator